MYKLVFFSKILYVKSREQITSHGLLSPRNCMFQRVLRIAPCSFASSIRAMSTHPPPVFGRSFKLALVQLGETSPDKATNLARAKDLVEKAAKGSSGDGDVDLVVLPECFNSLYGTRASNLAPA